MMWYIVRRVIYRVLLYAALCYALSSPCFFNEVLRQHLHFFRILISLHSPSNPASIIGDTAPLCQIFVLMI